MTTRRTGGNHGIIVDWSLMFARGLSKTGAELLFELVSQRYERAAVLITSNLPFDEWTETFGTERLTGALLDRLTHHVHILEMNSQSFRLNHSRAQTRARRPDLRVGASRKLRSGYALPSFPADTAPGLIPAPSDISPRRPRWQCFAPPLVWFLSALTDGDVALDALRANGEAGAAKACVSETIARSDPCALRGGVDRDEGSSVRVRGARHDADRAPVQRRIGGLLAGGEETVGRRGRATERERTCRVLEEQLKAEYGNGAEARRRGWWATRPKLEIRSLGGILPVGQNAARGSGTQSSGGAG